jgi:hypothetical protein
MHFHAPKLPWVAYRATAGGLKQAAPLQRHNAPQRRWPRNARS